MTAAALAILDWARRNIVPTIAILLGVVLLGVVAWNWWTAGTTANTRVKLERNQAGAAIQSGKDAIGTLGNRQVEDAQGTETVTETQHEIDNATDAGGVTDAGRNGLCDLRGYRSRPECVRRPAAR